MTHNHANTTDPLPMPPSLDTYTTPEDLRRLILQAKAEDLGPDKRDITSEYFVDAQRTGTARIVARKTGRLAGVAILTTITELYNPAIAVTIEINDGQDTPAGATIAQLSGPLQSILAVERLALNFITHLSGVATLTALFVRAIADTKAKICDTRKTLPGLRALQKYAVACGGGHNHRVGLYDAMLVKDNHLAQLSPNKNLASTVKRASVQARADSPPPRFVEVEVDTLDQLQVLLTDAGQHVDMVLLDNMPPDVLRQAVATREKLAPNVLLEASGGITIENVRSVAQTGVDRISVGALTHSAPALDIAMDIT